MSVTYKQKRYREKVYQATRKGCYASLSIALIQLKVIKAIHQTSLLSHAMAVYNEVSKDKYTSKRDRDDWNEQQSHFRHKPNIKPTKHRKF